MVATATLVWNMATSESYQRPNRQQVLTALDASATMPLRTMVDRRQMVALAAICPAKETNQNSAADLTD